MPEVKVIWSAEAMADLRKIYAITLALTQSRQGALAVKRDIFKNTKSIKFIHQHQTDEFLGQPFRRIIVRQYRIIYVEKSQDEIHILTIFNSRNNPIRLIKPRF